MSSMTIVYTSKTGSTQTYAQLLGEETGLPVLPLAQALRQLPQGSGVIYLGWVMAGHISGLDKAVKTFSVACACGVGMMSPGQVDPTAYGRANYLPGGPLFYVQGGYAPEKLKGPMRWMLALVTRNLRKGLEERSDLSPEERQQLQMFSHGGSFVCRAALAPLIQWLEQQG